MTVGELIERFENLAQDFGSRDGGKCISVLADWPEYQKSMGHPNWNKATVANIHLPVIEARYLQALVDLMRAEARDHLNEVIS